MNAQVKIVEEQVGIAKKISKSRINEALDGTAIAEAEKVVVQSAPLFRKATNDDFVLLTENFESLTPENLTSRRYNTISEIAFSIKSRAANAGTPLASEVANSLYKFCDQAAKKLPAEGYTVIKLHFHALEEIFDGKFIQDDSAQAGKLIAGLHAVVRKLG